MVTCYLIYRARQAHTYQTHHTEAAPAKVPNRHVQISAPPSVSRSSLPSSWHSGRKVPNRHAHTPPPPALHTPRKTNSKPNHGEGQNMSRQTEALSTELTADLLSSPLASSPCPHTRVEVNCTLGKVLQPTHVLFMMPAYVCQLVDSMCVRVLRCAARRSSNSKNGARHFSLASAAPTRCWDNLTTRHLCRLSVPWAGHGEHWTTRQPNT